MTCQNKTYALQNKQLKWRAGSGKHLWCRKEVLVGINKCSHLPLSPYVRYRVIVPIRNVLNNISYGKSRFLSIFIHVLALLLHYTWTAVWWTSSNNPVHFSVPLVSTTTQWFILFFRTSICRKTNLKTVYVTFYIRNGRYVSARWTDVTAWCPQRAYVCGEWRSGNILEDMQRYFVDVWFRHAIICALLDCQDRE